MLPSGTGFANLKRLQPYTWVNKPRILQKRFHIDLGRSEQYVKCHAGKHSILSFLSSSSWVSPRSISSLALTANTVMGRGRVELGWGLMGGGVDPLEGGKSDSVGFFYLSWQWVPNLPTPNPLKCSRENHVSRGSKLPLWNQFLSFLVGFCISRKEGGCSGTLRSGNDPTLPASSFIDHDHQRVVLFFFLISCSPSSDTRWVQISRIWCGRREKRRKCREHRVRVITLPFRRETTRNLVSVHKYCHAMFEFSATFNTGSSLLSRDVRLGITLI